MTTILFDLDGTLIDTTDIVLPAFKQTLTAFGEPIPDEQTLRSTFGMPDDQIWKMLMPAADSDNRLRAFRQTEQTITAAMYTTDILIPQARMVLDTLRQRGYTLSTASNCGTRYLEAVLDSQELRPLFSNPLCLEAVRGQTKADILRTHFEHIDRKDVVMVGDRASDVAAAHEHGVPVVGCQLQFASGASFAASEELADADVLIHDLRELLPLFPTGKPHQRILSHMDGGSFPTV